jgi:hypothetical protein
MFERTRSLLQRLTRADTGARIGDEERRRWERLCARPTVRVHLGVHDADTVVAEIREVSRGGIRLVVDCPVDSGTTLRIDLPKAAGDGKFLLACVVHAALAPDGTFALGCNFTNELADDDLEAFGAKRLRPRYGDQRAWERWTVSGEARYTRIGATGDPGIAEIQNLSPTGIGLRTCEELVPSTMLDLELRNRDGDSVVALLACVVYLTAVEEGQWLVGCNFVRELFDEDLKGLIAPTPPGGTDC